MKNNRIKNFNDFVNESYNPRVNEGFFSGLVNLIKRVGGWAGEFIKAIGQGLIKPIPSGPMKGMPVAMLFLPENGPVYQQMMKYQQGVNPLKESVSYELEEAIVPLEYTGADQSVRNVTAEELKKRLIKLYRSKQRGGRAKPIFIYGAPGIGKTQIVNSLYLDKEGKELSIKAIGEAADALKIPVLKLDLQFMNPEDFLGIPSKHDIEAVEIENGKVTNSGRGFTRANPPRILPTDNGKDDRGGIIFMDEMNRSKGPVQNSIMQFVQEGRIGDYQLPDKWVIVAAGNRPEEADVTDFDFALADRFVIYNYVPNVESWADWARSNGKIFPELVAFLMNNQNLFHELDIDKEVKNFPSPRSWSDSALQVYDEVQDENVNSWRDLPDQVIHDIFFDNVGPFAAGKIAEYLKILKKISIQDIEKIKTDPDNSPIIEAAREKSILYGFSSMVASSVTEYSPVELYNVVKYFARYDQLEMLSWLYKSILEKYPQFRPPSVATGNEEDTMKLDAAKMIISGARNKGL
jgi:MoxR-like ATPase